MPVDPPRRQVRCNTDCSDIIRQSLCAARTHRFLFDGNRFEFFWFELKIFALADLISFDDIGGLHFISGFRIDFAILDAVPGVFIDLMETDFFSFAGCRIQRYRTRDERELQISLPIGTRCHDLTPYTQQNAAICNQCGPDYVPNPGLDAAEGNPECVCDLFARAAT